MRTTKVYRVVSTPMLTLLALLFFVATITAAPGDLDPTFGVGGKVIDQSGGSYDVAIQPDGKIVAVGVAAGGSEGAQIAVARYNIDGSPDTTFGGTGRVLIDHYQIAVDVAIQPDGKIVVAGRNPDGDVYGELVRLNSDGSLDTSFGTNGIVAPLFTPSVAAILPDGKSLIALAARLFRLNANGSFDMTFGPCGPGVVTIHYLYNRSESVIQPDGRILTAFTAGNNDFGVFRCNADGTLDNGFGSGGVVITPISSGLDVAQSIAIQMDGKIVVTGQSQSNTNTDWQLTVVRYNPNGALDSGFGTGGIATTPTGITYWNPPLNRVAIQTDGRILAATTIENGSRDFALVRYNPNGSLDTTFNGTGKVITPITNGNDYAHSVAIQADGKIVVAGAGEYGSDFYGLVVRYQGDAPSSSCLSANPIDCAEFFARQHYRDFLNREPDASGLAFWSNEITSCGGDQQCTEVKRVNVSAAFFLSIEFQQTGYLAYRIYKAAYGNLPNAPVPIRLGEFLPDTRQIGQGVVVLQPGWETMLENNKQAFISEFMQRERFASAFPSTMTAEEFVDQLNANAGNPLSETERDHLASDLSTGAKTRPQVLRAVAEDPDLISAEFNRAFVLMQYFGYVRRNPDDAPDGNFEGYNFWLTKLNQFDGNFLNAEMVKAFMTSTEYRQRFGP